MLPAILLAGLSLAAPDYTKKVMVDPEYKSTRTPEQIARALEAARSPRVVAVPAARHVRVVRRVEARYRYVRRHDWVWPVLGVGLYWGAHHAIHRHHHGHGFRYHRVRWHCR